MNRMMIVVLAITLTGCMGSVAELMDTYSPEAMAQKDCEERIAEVTERLGEPDRVTNYVRGRYTRRTLHYAETVVSFTWGLRDQYSCRVGRMTVAGH